MTISLPVFYASEYIDVGNGNAALYGFDGLLNWESEWRAIFHPPKCVHLSITLKRKPIVTSYYMRNHTLKATTTATSQGNY